MSLFWPADEDRVVTDAPRLHALVVGVGDYDHLGLNAVKPASFLTGLAPLDTTPRSARRVARWLESDYANEDCPLGSVELLLSPAERLARTDGSEVEVEKATMAAIKAAFKRWYVRADRQRENIAFFYFAGHGISTLSRFLLPADFGNPDEPDDFENCIDATMFQAGMLKNSAQTQLYFFDACRDAPIEALVHRNPHGDPMVTSTFHDKVELSAAYSAASEGRKAYGRDGEETFFCKALMLCLEGAAARKPGPRWQVDAASLSSAMATVIDILRDVENEPLSGDFQMQRPVPLHFPPSASVVVKVDCATDKARLEANIRVRQNRDVVDSPAGEKRPWMRTMGVGPARIEVDFQSFTADAIDDEMSPPTYEWEVDR